MEPDTPNRLLDPSAHLEQLKPYAFKADLSQLGLSKHMETEKRQELIAERMQLQPKGIGPITVAGEPVPRKIQLKLLDPILALASLVVPGKDLLSPARTVGDHKADIAPQGRDLDFDHDPSLPGPASGPVAKAVEDLNRLSGAGIFAPGLLKPALSPSLEDRVGRDPNGIENLKGFQSGVNLRHRRARIGPIADLAFGEALPKDGNKAAKLAWNSLCGMGITRPKTSRKQTTCMSLKEKQRVIHVLVILAVEEGKDLLSVAGVVGGITVQKDLLGNLSFTVAVLKEPLKAKASKPTDSRPLSVILQSRERWLGSQRIGFAHNRLKGGIGAKRVRIIAVLIACGDLVDPLAEHLMGVVLNKIWVTPVVKQTPKPSRKGQLPIKFPQEQKARVAGDLTTVKIQNNFPLKSEPQLGMTLCSHRPSFHCVRLKWFSTLSIPQLDGVGGFFILSTMNNAG